MENRFEEIKIAIKAKIEILEMIKLIKPNNIEELKYCEGKIDGLKMALKEIEELENKL